MPDLSPGWLIPAALLVAAATACSGDPCEPYCSHPIDRLVVPHLREIGLAPREVDPYEHCRRIAVDFLGRGPSGSEIEACAAASVDRRVELALESPDYVSATRRQWAEILAYDVLELWSRDLHDLDALVADLAAGAISYEEFATAAVVHPGFVGLHGEDEWAAATYRVFLGRPAREDEIAALRPLSAPWHSRYLCEGTIWWNYYELYLDEAAPAEASEFASFECADSGKANVGFNPCMCQPDEGQLGCASDALGTPISFAAACVDGDEPYDQVNVMRVGPSSPGQTDICPDGSRNESCRDREVDEDDELTLLPVQEWRPLDEASRAALDQVGAALAARTDFWEAAVDRELRRLTGWWQGTFRHPDSDLPEVRALLVEEMRDGASLRDIQRLIATSQLYAAPAEAPAGWRIAEAPPPWASGPTKLLSAELWLDTVMRAVGEEPASCDVRNLTVYGYEYELGDWTVLDDFYSSMDDEVEDFYIEALEALGGCKARSPRPRQSSVGLAFAQGEQARLVCAHGDETTPRGWDGEPGAAAAHLIRRLFHRPPRSGEVDELVGEMEECVDAGACVDDDAAARWLCWRLADSTEFATY
jgi:Protein of unknown function (DUF1549)